MTSGEMLGVYSTGCEAICEEIGWTLASALTGPELPSDLCGWKNLTPGRQRIGNDRPRLDLVTDARAGRAEPAQSGPAATPPGLGSSGGTAGEGNSGPVSALAGGQTIS